MSAFLPSAVPADALRPTRRTLLALPLVAVLGGCAAFGGETLDVSLVGLEPLGGEGLEMRLQAKLRLMNAGNAEVAFNGISLELELRGNRLAGGVSPQSGRIPRFGELVVTVPVSVSALAVLREAFALARQGGGARTRLEFAARGRLGGSGPFGGRSFAGRGEIEWPPGSATIPPEPAPATRP
jgi:hypothetical protein